MRLNINVDHNRSVTSNNPGRYVISNSYNVSKQNQLQVAQQEVFWRLETIQTYN